MIFFIMGVTAMLQGLLWLVLFGIAGWLIGIPIAIALGYYTYDVERWFDNR